MRHLSLLVCCSLLARPRRRPGAGSAGRPAAAPAGPGRADDPGAAAKALPRRREPRARRRTSGTSPPATARAATCRSTRAPAPGWRSTSRPTGGRSPSTCWATSMSCRSSGGEARPLLTGHAWEMQPRYSPDGHEIAFTSDRGGGDNIWAMGRDGSEPAPDHQGRLPPAEPGRLDARRQLHRRPQAFHLVALARRGRDVALPPRRRRQGAACR